MDYEEKYNTALERARDLMTNQNPPAFDKHLIEMVFPELKESRDERIKREILELVSIAGNGNQFEEIKDWLEKQDKWRTEDKLEPKFHEGEWITNGDYNWRIVDVKPLDYTLQSQDGNVVNDDISYVDKHFHLWTIQDAENKELKKIESKMLDADKVIEWLKTNVFDDSAYGKAMIDKFKEDIGL